MGLNYTVKTYFVSRTFYLTVLFHCLLNGFKFLKVDLETPTAH